jgi:histone H3/H4
MVAPKKRQIRHNRDNHLRIKNGMIRRHAIACGAKGVASLVYESYRACLKEEIKEWMRKVLTYTEHARRMTVKVKDLENVLTLKSYRVPHITGTSAFGSLEEIKKSNAEGFFLAVGPFQDLVREIGGDMKVDMRYSEKFMLVFQHVIEVAMNHHLTLTVALTSFKGAKAIKVTHFQMAHAIISGTYNHTAPHDMVSYVSEAIKIRNARGRATKATAAKKARSKK